MKQQIVEQKLSSKVKNDTKIKYLIAFCCRITIKAVNLQQNQTN